MARSRARTFSYGGRRNTRGTACDAQASHAAQPVDRSVPLRRLTNQMANEPIVAPTHDLEMSATDLFRAHWTSAWQTAYRVTGRRDLADDVAQDALVAAVRRMEEFRGESAVATWIHRIVINRAIDAIRREEREDRKRERAACGSESGDRRPDDEIVLAVRQLSTQRRIPLVLRYWLDCTPSEIAGLLDVPVGTVNSRIARAIAELRERLEVQHV